MQKSSLFFMIVLILGFIFYEHKMTPSVPVPTKYQMQGNHVKVPVLMKIQTTPNEYWTLSRNPKGPYYVSVFNNYRLVRQFATGNLIKKNTSGSDYSVAGQNQIKFGMTLMKAEQVHVNPNGKSGYIEFQTSSLQSSLSQGNSTQGSTGQ